MATKNNSGIVDPFKGVVNPESLVEQLRKLRDGDLNARSYIRGSLQWLERRPPNRQIVPLLKTALKKYR